MSLYLGVPLVLVPDEPQLGVGGHGVVGADVAVEQGTLDPDGLPRQNPVPLQVHRPVDAPVHWGERTYIHIFITRRARYRVQIWVFRAQI